MNICKTMRPNCCFTLCNSLKISNWKLWPTNIRKLFYFRWLISNSKISLWTKWRICSKFWDLTFTKPCVTSKCAVIWAKLWSASWLSISKTKIQSLKSVPTSLHKLSFLWEKTLLNNAERTSTAYLSGASKKGMIIILIKSSLWCKMYVI